MDSYQNVSGQPEPANIKIYRELFDSIDLGFCVMQLSYDGDGNPSDAIFLETNAVFQAQAGITDTKGKMVGEVLPDMERSLLDIFHQVATTGISARFEQQLSHNGNCLEVFASRLPDVRNDKVIAIVSDNTSRKELCKISDKEIRRLKLELSSKRRELDLANSDLATFSSIAANDYNETLRTLYTNLEYVARNDAQNFSNAGKANLRKAQTAIQKLKLLTEDIVAFSRIHEMGQMEERVDLDRILDSILRDLEPKILESGIRIEREPLPVIKGYPLQLSLLFHHLVDNAIKFRSAEPLLKITCRQIVLDIPYHEICFTDNGIGIPPNETENIFGIFYRLNDRQMYKGSGVGLAVCRKVMDLHKGFVKAGSNGDGSVFGCCFLV